MARRLHRRLVMGGREASRDQNEMVKLSLPGAEFDAEIKMGEPVRTQITEIVEAMLARRGRTPFIEADQSLTDAGLASLDMVNLMLAIEDQFGIEIPQRRMTPANFRTIAAIEQLVSGLALAA